MTYYDRSPALLADGCSVEAEGRAFKLLSEPVGTPAAHFLHLVALDDLAADTEAQIRAAFADAASRHGRVFAIEIDPTEIAQRFSDEFWPHMGFVRAEHGVELTDGSTRPLYVLHAAGEAV